MEKQIYLYNSDTLHPFCNDCSRIEEGKDLGNKQINLGFFSPCTIFACQ